MHKKPKPDAWHRAQTLFMHQSGVGDTGYLGPLFRWNSSFDACNSSSIAEQRLVGALMMQACFAACKNNCLLDLNGIHKFNRTVHILAWFQEHVVNPCLLNGYPSNECQNPGFEAELVYDALTAVGYSINWRVVNATDTEADIVAAAVLKGDFDLIVPTVSYNWYRRTRDEFSNALGEEAVRNFNISKTVASDKFIFMHRFGLVSRTTTSLLLNRHIASWEVWALLIVTFLAIFMADKFVKSGHWDLSGTSAIRMVRMGRGTWYIALAVVFGVYTNFLAITLAQPAPWQELFSDILGYSRLLVSKQCRVVVHAAYSSPSENIYAQYIDPPDIDNNETTDLHRKAAINIREAFKTNPPLFVNTYEELYQALHQDKCHIGIVYWGDVIFARLYLAKLLENIYIVDLPDATQYLFGFLHNRRSPSEVIKVLERVLSGVGESSQLVYRTRKTAHLRRLFGPSELTDCPYCKPGGHSESYEPLNLFQLAEVFLLSSGGFAVAAALVLGERCAALLRRPRRRRGSDGISIGRSCSLC